MLQQTHTSGREHGLMVSYDGQKLLTSRIFAGLGEQHCYGNNTKHPPSFRLPFLPHGFKSLDPRIRNLALIHTHPTSDDINHLPTTVISEADILAYAQNSYNALVMIDKGGVHMLTGKDPLQIIDARIAHKIVEDAFKIVRSNSNTVVQLREVIAKSLKHFGIRYYFSADKTPTEDGYLILEDSASSPILT
ncbi:MAG: hypothetical protein KatS3mg089_0599 [Patescibacteria group bacterium]|nr:MAG: hypothetical protein KatS3mg089_0599 [Patescibacteria group bacterium]